jgi:hypothetical protein
MCMTRRATREPPSTAAAYLFRAPGPAPRVRVTEVRADRSDTMRCPGGDEGDVVVVGPTSVAMKRWYGRGTRVASMLYSAAGARESSDTAWLVEQLEARGVPFIHYEHGRRTVLLVPEADRSRLVEVLRRTRWLVSDQWGGQSPARLLGGRLPVARSSTWDLRIRPGASPDPRIEFWVPGEDEWRPPGESLLARPVAAPAPATTRPRRTSELAPDARSTTLPIDVVYTWVDGSDPAWQARRAPVAPSTGGVDASASRYHDRDELRYSLRSLRANAPWVRRIFLVTDQQRPSWLVGDEVTVVDHRELFPDPEVLPTFNSHAIETVLHRVPDLAEHFVYFNDDVFLGRPVAADVFFSPGGLARVSFSATTIDYLSDEPYARAWRGMADLVEQHYGARPLHVLRHTPHPMIRSEMAHLEEEFPEEFARIRGQRFRGEGDIPPVALSRYTMLLRGTGFERSYPYDYINLSRGDASERLARLPRSARSVDSFCLNDTSGDAPPDEQVVAALRATFPTAAPWEAEA